MGEFLLHFNNHGISFELACRAFFDPFVISLDDEVVFDENYSLYDYLSHHERRFIIKALKEKNGVKKHAADLLNIPESTLRLKIKQYGIDLMKIKNK